MKLVYAETALHSAKVIVWYVIQVCGYTGPYFFKNAQERLFFPDYC